MGYSKHNNYEPAEKHLKSIKQRALFVVSVLIAMFFIIIIRLFTIMILNNTKNKNHSHSQPICINRADIHDRNGLIIATSLPTVSLYCCPHEILNSFEAISKLSKIFPNDKNLKEKITSSKKFIWIKRHLSPTQEQSILNQGIPGLHFLKTEKRVYPDKNLCSHIIGGADIDNIGIAGIEKVFDEKLRNQNDPINLSIHIPVQHTVYQELKYGINEFKAIGGAAVVLSIKTGEIISLVSLPDFDPNKISNPNDRGRFNLITSSAIEPGSSAKIFNTAMALENGIQFNNKYDTRFPIKVGRFSINDFRGKKTFLTMEEILKFSSNIGSAKIAMQIGAENQKKFLKHIGLLDSINCELSETQRPIYPQNWTEVSAMTIAFGHGIAFSPLHIIAVFAGIVNNGLMQNPTLLKSNNISSEYRIISENTSNQIKALIRLNVTEGTNKLSNVAGYCVGGKSGTAEKVKGRRYAKNANYCSFIGAFPMTDPEYAVYVLLDEPKGIAKTHGYAGAGWNATSIAGNIIKKIGPILSVKPNKNQEPDWHEKLEKLSKRKRQK